MTHPTDPPTDLERYRWQRRPLLLFAPDRDHPTFRRQRELLAGREGDLEERELTVLELLADAAHPSSLLAARLRDRYDVAPGAFALLLIGKDGGCKRRGGDATDLDILFAQIDAMPMRVREMRGAEG